MRFLLPIILSLILFGCSDRHKAGQFSADNTGILSYAKSFILEKHPGYILLSIRNPRDTGYVLDRFVLVERSARLPDTLPQGTVLRIPVEKTIAFGTVPCGALSELKALHTLTGVTEPEYINIDSVRSGIPENRIADVGRSMMPDIEKIVMLAPDVIFTSPLDRSLQDKLTRMGIKVITCTEFTENTPLGRAEWIKLYGLLTGRANRADSLFRETERNYEQAKRTASDIAKRPLLMVEKRYGQTWYMPSGNSYTANMYRDAGADYNRSVYGTNPEGSIPWSFEQVWERYADADIWLFKYYDPMHDETTLSELQRENETYRLFKPFKTQRIYACNTAKTPYYELAAFRPDLILYDLIGIFHPELLPGQPLRFFHQLKP